MRPRILIALYFLIGGLFIPHAIAAGEAAEAAKPDAAATLDSLLQKVLADRSRETRANRRREARFLAAKTEQRRLLREAKTVLAAVERRSDQLKAEYDKNEKKLSELETVLNERLGSLGEMFGIVRLVAGDTKGLFEASLVSAQIPGRTKFLGDLAQRKELPSIGELEKLWYELLREMVASGKVISFPATVVKPDGKKEQRQVTRVGVFSAVSDGRYLIYQSDTGQLVELGRQPASRFLSLAGDLEQARSGIVPMAIDPSRGAILSLLVQAPGLLERIAQGRTVGYVIILLGLVGLGLVVWRYLVLRSLDRGIKTQLKRTQPSADNPLGRIMMCYREDKTLDAETLGLKLDEAIIKEMPQFERGLPILKILAAVAPLLGLLGTVTGMIETFQTITLFGTGDPKLMAGGISQALVTTEFGLLVAIPLILLHSFLAGKSADLGQVLDAQSAGMVAMRAEK